MKDKRMLEEEIFQKLEEQANKYPLAQAAIEHIRTRTNDMRLDQLEIMETMQSQFESEKSSDISIHEVAKTVKQIQSEELVNIKLFNQSNFVKADPWRLGGNRMEYIITKTLEYFGDDETKVAQLYSGTMPTEIINRGYFTTYLPVLNTSNFWGNNDATIFSNALLAIRFATTPETIADYTYHSIAHVLDCDDGLPEEYSKSSYAFNKNGLTGFGIVHAGYSRGGPNLKSKLYINTKVYPPHDCCSFVSELTRSKYQWFAEDAICAYRVFADQGGMIKDDFVTSGKKDDFLNIYTGIVKPEDLLPGDVVVTRDFYADNSKPYGAGGHAGIYFGKDPRNSANAFILKFDRDMTCQDASKDVWGVAGAGIRSVPSADVVDEKGKTTRVLGFRPRPKA